MNDKSHRLILAAALMALWPHDTSVRAAAKPQNGIAGIVLLQIPGGSFDMGSNRGAPSEGPVHQVEISPLCVSATKITQGQYEEVTGKHPSAFHGEDRLPVETVTWFDAARFCNLLSDRAGLERCYDERAWACDFSKSGFRLPTEAEWEYLCRAGSKSDYFFGDSPARLADYAWFGNTGAGNADDLLRPVALKKSNPWGLYDICGDVWEWCNDWFDPDAYRHGGVRDPQGPVAGELRVIRGGSFVSEPRFLTSYHRDSYVPSLNYLDIGFRVVRSSAPRAVNSWPKADMPPEEGAANPRRAGLKVETIDGIVLVAIPAGRFRMGADDADALWDEKPVHEVILDPFFIGETEVTQEQYRRITGSNPSHFSGFPNLPLECVSWTDAARFCNRLSQMAGLQKCYDETTWKCDFSKNGYRLPTEAEFEYAARAGATSPVSWAGGRYEDFSRVAWFQGNSASKTHPVATKPANPFGLFDAQGNIWEWINDWYQWDYYTISPERNPTGPDYGVAKVTRGGRFFSWIRHARITRRSAVPVRYQSDGYGFRVARNRPAD